MAHVQYIICEIEVESEFKCEFKNIAAKYIHVLMARQISIHASRYLALTSM